MKSTIRRTVNGERDLFDGVTPFESQNNQKLIDDYLGVITDIWSDMGGSFSLKNSLNS